MDYGHPERAFFQKLETFGLGQTNWAEILWGIWGISGQTISFILSLWAPCLWESVAGSLSYKKLWFLGLKHITPKYSQNKILAIKNLGNSVHTSVFGSQNYIISFLSASLKLYNWKSKALKSHISSMHKTQRFYVVVNGQNLGSLFALNLFNLLLFLFSLSITYYLYYFIISLLNHCIISMLTYNVFVIHSVTCRKKYTY